MAETTPRLSLLIATQNRRDELRSTLGAMLPIMPAAADVIVFDDGSTDSTTEAVRQAFPRVRVISRGRPGGYIAARNRLLSEARGELALSLDDDAEILTPDFADRVSRYFAANPRCGVVAFRIFWGKERPPVVDAGLAGPVRVNSFVGCGHVWRMAAWRSVPPYPEWFQFHGEENYAALQLLRHGWEVHYLPDVLVHHRVDRAARRGERSLWRYRRQLRAGILLMLLFYPRRVLPRYLAYSCWTQVRLRLVQERNWRAAASLVWVLLDVIAKLPRVALERTPLTPSEWTAWRHLPEVPVYWEPKGSA